MMRPLLVAFFALALAAPASAQSYPAGGLTATELANWLGSASHPATVKPDPTTSGDQIVSTTIDGVETDIYLYDCSGDGDARRCTSAQYVTARARSPAYTLEKVNEWNHGHRYIRAYLTPGGSLYGEYDFDFSPGGTWDMLNDTLGNWQTTAADFTKFFGS